MVLIMLFLSGRLVTVERATSVGWLKRESQLLMGLAVRLNTLSGGIFCNIKTLENRCTIYTLVISF